MFWGLVIRNDKQYSHVVDKSFHISMAVLEGGKAGSSPTKVMVTVNDETYLLCALSMNHPQQQLDLNFEEGESVVFFSQDGPGNVHLSGYNLEGDVSDFSDEEEETESEAEKPETPVTDSKKRKPEKALPTPGSAKKMKTNATSPQKPGQKKQLALMAEDDDDSDEDISDLDLSDLDEEEGSDEELEEAEEEEEEEDSEDDEPPKLAKTPQKKLQTPVPGSGKGSAKKQMQTPVTPMDGKKKKPHVATPYPGTTPASLQNTPMSNGTQSEKKKKKKNKKNKENTDEPQKTPKKTIKGGITLEELKPGTGPEVGKGKYVQIYYEGKLKGSNKVFDSNKEGKGLKFKLGAGEVIKGLEFGMDGMKVGGRRKLTIPPKMGYGHQGAGKDIPPNSTLEFDIELKAVN